VTSPDARQNEWTQLSDERLLDVRLCDLRLSLRTSPLKDRIARLRRELRGRGLRFDPHFWISDEWFTPDGVPGIAVPFYLVHPRLTRLELNQMLEVEGGTEEWCMNILRHEAGHAVDNAYALRRRRQRQRLFGRSSTRYPEIYRPRPYSKRCVIHLDHWYAQSHPDEDFAETFAVWLAHPPEVWRQRYAGWPALRKLEYMHALMQEIAGREAVVQTHRKVDPLDTHTKTLRQHYQARRDHYGVTFPAEAYDRDLRRLFSDRPEHQHHLSALRFLRRYRRDVRRTVARWTGAYQYTIDQVLSDVVARCRALNLRIAGTEEQTKRDFAVLLTVHVMNYLHSGGYEVAL
jgi:hypothetical protein